MPQGSRLGALPVGTITGDPTVDDDGDEVPGVVTPWAAWNFVNSTMVNGPLPAYVARTGGDWSSRHTMAWSRKGASNQLVFGEIHWSGTETATPTGIDPANVGSGWGAQLGAWYMGAVVRLGPATLTAPGATVDTVIRSFYSKVVTPYDWEKRYSSTANENLVPHPVINGGRQARARQNTRNLQAFRDFSNAGSWGSNHPGAMLGAFGDGRVQTINETVPASVICNLAGTDAPFVTSL